VTKIKKKIISITIIAVLGFLLFVNLPIPISIEATALEIMLNDPDHLIERTVTINGRYRIGLFAPYRRFRSSIKILGLTYGEMDTIRLHRNPHGGHRFALMFYKTDSPPFPGGFGNPSGVIYPSLFFRQATIIASYNGILSSHYSPLIVLNATCRDDAIMRLPFRGY